MSMTKSELNKVAKQTIDMYGELPYSPPAGSSQGADYSGIDTLLLGNGMDSPFAAVAALTTAAAATAAPTDAPTVAPTAAPTVAPSVASTAAPVVAPTNTAAEEEHAKAEVAVAAKSEKAKLTIINGTTVANIVTEDFAMHHFPERLHQFHSDDRDGDGRLMRGGKNYLYLMVQDVFGVCVPGVSKLQLWPLLMRYRSNLAEVHRGAQWEITNGRLRCTPTTAIICFIYLTCIQCC